MKFIFLIEDHFIPYIIFLDKKTLRESIATSYELANEGASPDEGQEGYLKSLKLISLHISVLLYICSKKPDIINPDNPNSRPNKKAKPSDNPRVWEVGYRIGTALKQARLNEEAQQKDQSSHQRPRAHIRRAHWHHYWTGALKSEDRHLELRWIPPIGVNLDLEADLPVVIRNIE